MRLQTTCFAVFLFIQVAACNIPFADTAPVAAPTLSRPCGTSCETNVKLKPSDCPPDCASQTVSSSKKSSAVPGDAPNTYQVTNPNGGAALYAAVSYPGTWNGNTKQAALVLVPGGSSGSSSFANKNPKGASTVSVLNEAGFAVVIFDPDGRGKSQGKEDYDGFLQQDGLAQVIRFAATLPGMDAARIGLVTFSYGITMGSGALSRYSDLPVRFLIDWEGPANRDDTGGCDSAKVGHLKEVAACTDEAFWAEREASAFIGKIRVPYQRIQSEKDHAQPDYAHTVLLINNAVQGGVPWVRLNDEMLNQTYTLTSLPHMLPESMDGQRDQRIARYALELFGR
jgi:hypothetical protein